MATTIEEGFNQQDGGRKTTRPRTVIEETSSINQDGITKTESNKVLAGFLYSFSRTEAGEYFPIYEGRNSIGNRPDADVPLFEKLVSENHADIYVIKKADEPKLDFRIKDGGSTNSTFCDKQQLFAGDVALLKERSVLKIGGYVLKVILIDKFAENLGLNPAFSSSKPLKPQQPDNIWDMPEKPVNNPRKNPTID